MTYSGGGVYEVDFVDNKLHCKGRLTNSDGGVYEGDFVNNKRHGKGRMTDSDGNVWEVFWNEGPQCESFGNETVVRMFHCSELLA